MANNNSRKKDWYHKDFKHFAQRGDQDLLRATKRLYNRHLKSNPNISRSVITLLVSNEFISKFEIPVTFKDKRLRRKTGINFVGDKVEAYIYFLRINYGIDAVERYLIKQYKRLIDERIY